MTLLEAVKTDISSIFRVTDYEYVDLESVDINKWNVVPDKSSVLNMNEDDDDYYYVIKAKNILESGEIIDCYIDMNLPERISSYAIFLKDGKLLYGDQYTFEGEIISAVAINAFGLYETFYSKINPNIGISVLKNGLAICKKKAIIAEDLGYILRDEKKYAEAIDAFSISINEGPSSYFIYKEIAYCNKQIGNNEQYDEYTKLFEYYRKK